MDSNIDNNVELLIAAGRALYGDRWQTDLAAALGISDARRVREWLSGARRIPPGIWSDIILLIDNRFSVMSEVREKIVLQGS